MAENVLRDAKNRSETRDGLFSGNNPFDIATHWLEEAWKTEPNDANAIAIATAGASGLPNVRMVLLKEIEQGGFVFYTNSESAKGSELAANGQAAFVMHWKTLGRQVRARGPQSRAGAVASAQSRPLEAREGLVEATAAVREKYGDDHIPRPDHWQGYRIRPIEIEFWADGEFRLHDRFRWTRDTPEGDWSIERLNP